MQSTHHLLLATAFVFCSAVFHRAALLTPPPTTPPIDKAEEVEADANDQEVKEERAKTWTLHARAAARRVELDEKAAEKLAETYVEHRQQLEELIQEMRQEWIEDLEKRIERARESRQPIPPSLYDRTELESNIFSSQQKARTRLAKALVEIMEKEKAEKIFHSLAAFDRRIDTMIGKLVKFKLEDEKAFPVVDTLDLYFEELQIQRKIQYPDEKSRTLAIRKVREELIRRINPHLNAEQLAEFKAYVGVR